MDIWLIHGATAIASMLTKEVPMQVISI
jgi:hypothetical protein